MVRWLKHQETTNPTAIAKRIAKAQDIFHDLTHDKYNYAANDEIAVIDGESTKEELVEKLEHIREELMETQVTTTHTKHRIHAFVHKLRGKHVKPKKHSKLHQELLDTIMLIYDIRHAVDIDAVQQGNKEEAKRLKRDLTRIGKHLSTLRQLATT